MKEAANRGGLRVRDLAAVGPASAAWANMEAARPLERRASLVEKIDRRSGRQALSWNSSVVGAPYNHATIKSGATRPIIPILNHMMLALPKAIHLAQTD